MSELQAQHPQQGDVVSDIAGVVRRIRGYTTEYRSGTTALGYRETTDLITYIDLLADDGTLFSVDFHGFIDKDAVGHRFSYRQVIDNKNGEPQDTWTMLDTMTQELIPEEDSQPSYKAVNIRLLK